MLSLYLVGPFFTRFWQTHKCRNICVILWWVPMNHHRAHIWCTQTTYHTTLDALYVCCSLAPDWRGDPVSDICVGLPFKSIWHTAKKAQWKFGLEDEQSCFLVNQFCFSLPSLTAHQVRSVLLQLLTHPPLPHSSYHPPGWACVTSCLALHSSLFPPHPSTGLPWFNLS